MLFSPTDFLKHIHVRLVNIQGKYLGSHSHGNAKYCVCGSSAKTVRKRHDSSYLLMADLVLKDLLLSRLLLSLHKIMLCS